MLTFMRSENVDTVLRSERGPFAAVHQTWGEKTDVSDGERILAAQVSATVTARFIVRYTASNAGVTPADLIRIGEGAAVVYYAITGIKDVGFRDRLEFTAHTRDSP